MQPLGTLLGLSRHHICDRMFQWDVRLLDKVPNKQRPIGAERHTLNGLSEH